MAQRYSGVIDTIETNIYNSIYDFLSLCKFPFGYKFYTQKEEKGYKIIIQKDEEILENLDAKIGIENYRDIPDKIHRPPYYIKPKIVKEYLSCSLEEYKRKMRNKERNSKSLEQLRIFQLEIQKKNCLNYIRKIKDYPKDKILEIIETLNVENDEYNFEDYIDLSKEYLLDIIEYEFYHNCYNFIRRIILTY